MSVSRRALGLAAACSVTLSAFAASAQTVIVMGAPPQSPVELAINATVVGKATVDDAGVASLDVNLSENRGKPETDARIVVDKCSDLHRVTLAELAMQPPPLAQGCTRRELVGLFVVRQVTTFVVDVTNEAPTVRVRQGRAPAAWLRPGAQGPPPEREAPTGLILSGGGGWAFFSDPGRYACGTVAECSTKDTSLAYTASAAWWIGRFLAAEASYVKPGSLTTEGGGEGYRFDTALETDVVTLVGKIGAPVRVARVYGFGGATYHWATSTTTETLDDRTVTVDDVTETIPGGTQVFVMNTKGWGWLFGGGVEAWAKPRFAIYGELAYMKLKGPNADGGEGSMLQGATLVLAGIRVSLF